MLSRPRQGAVPEVLTGYLVKGAPQLWAKAATRRFPMWPGHSSGITVVSKSRCYLHLLSAKAEALTGFDLLSELKISSVCHARK